LRETPEGLSSSTSSEEERESYRSETRGSRGSRRRQKSTRREFWKKGEAPARNWNETNKDSYRRLGCGSWGEHPPLKIRGMSVWDPKRKRRNWKALEFFPGKKTPGGLRFELGSWGCLLGVGGRRPPESKEGKLGARGKKKKDFLRNRRGTPKFRAASNAA